MYSYRARQAMGRNAVGLDSGGRWRSNAKGNRRAGRRYGSCCIVIPRQGRNGDVAGRYARRPIRFPDVGCVACKFLRRTAVAAAEFLRVVGCGSSPRVCKGIVQSAQKRRKSALRCCVASPTALSLCSSRCARAEPFSSASVVLRGLPALEFPKLWRPSSYWTCCTRSQSQQCSNCCCSRLVFLFCSMLLLVLPLGKPNSATPATRTRSVNRARKERKVADNEEKKNVPKQARL